MDHKKANLKLSKKRAAIVVLVVLSIIAVVGLFLAMQPQRSVASFCSVAKQEKAVLTGDVSYEKRLESYKKLETVSPDDIRADITTIRKGYEEIVKNPSNTLNAGFGMSGAENRRTDYIGANCKDF